jgi:hypothetical protein
VIWRFIELTKWLAGFVREVGCGIAVGRGYGPVGEASCAHRGTRCGRRVAGERIRDHRRGRWSAGGRF